MRGLPKEWDVKTMAMRESKDLNQIELHDLFENLKAYEVELKIREGDEPTSQVTKALSALKMEPSGSNEKTAEQISSDAMAMFVKRFLENSLERTKEVHIKSNIIKRIKLMIQRLVIIVGRLDTLLSTAPNLRKLIIDQLREKKNHLIIRKNPEAIENLLKTNMRFL